MSWVHAYRPAVLALTLGLPLISAADLSQYRGFQFGASLPAVAKRAGINLQEARIVHKRPALIQELEWRPTWRYEANAKNMDPVQACVLRFYNGALFQIVTTYERDKIEGIKDTDMVESISRTYGTATYPGVQVPYRSNYGETATVVARWENPDYSYDLVRTGYQSSFVFILSMKRLVAVAQAASDEAVRLDVVEAPQREIDLEKQKASDRNVVLDKARSVNKPNFRP